MRNMFLFVSVLFISLASFAGVRGNNAGQDLGIFDTVQCSTGMTCARNQGKLVLTHLGQNTLVAATATTLTKAQCGSTFYNTGAVQVELPDAALVLGCTYNFVTLSATNFDVNPDNADRILPTTDANGDAIRNATLGNSITLRAVSASQWAVVSSSGTYTDIN